MDKPTLYGGTDKRYDSKSRLLESSKSRLFEYNKGSESKSPKIEDLKLPKKFRERTTQKSEISQNFDNSEKKTVCKNLEFKENSQNFGLSKR